jgi:hypothetical protein
VRPKSANVGVIADDLDAADINVSNAPVRRVKDEEVERTSKALKELAIENTLLRGKVDGA